MKTLFASIVGAFKRRNLRELVASDLDYNQRMLLDAQSKLQLARSTVDYHSSNINRLRTQLNELCTGADAQGA